MTNKSHFQESHPQRDHIPPANTDPGIVAAGGAMIGAGLGGGFPGAIIGGVIGFLIGIKAQKKRNS